MSWLHCKVSRRSLDGVHAVALAFSVASSPEECVKLRSPRVASINVFMVFNWPNVYCLDLSICLKSAKVIRVAWFQSKVLVSGWWPAIAYCLQNRQSGSLSLCLPFQLPCSCSRRYEDDFASLIPLTFCILPVSAALLWQLTHFSLPLMEVVASARSSCGAGWISCSSSAHREEGMLASLHLW